MPDRVPRLRRAPLPDDVIALVRGDTGEANQDRLDAVSFRRRFPDWPAFGVSGFYAVTEEGIDDLGGDMLRRFAALRIYDPLVLRRAKLDVLPTFRSPHVTIGFPDLEHGLSVLASSFRERRINPYHEA